MLSEIISVTSTLIHAPVSLMTLAAVNVGAEAESGFDRISRGEQCVYKAQCRVLFVRSC